MNRDPRQNSLSAKPQRPTASPMLVHAQIWRHVNKMPQDELASGADRLDYTLPIMGALAGNPNVKAKDVIKAVSQAAADGKIESSQAVAAISHMPAEPDKLRPWLRTMYQTNMAALVHMKAALMRGGQTVPGAASPPQAAPAAPAEPPPTSMTPQAAP